MKVFISSKERQEKTWGHMQCFLQTPAKVNGAMGLTKMRISLFFFFKQHQSLWRCSILSYLDKQLCKCNTIKICFHYIFVLKHINCIECAHICQKTQLIIIFKCSSIFQAYLAKATGDTEEIFCERDTEEIFCEISHQKNAD